MINKVIIFCLCMFLMTPIVFGGDNILTDREKEFLVNLSRQTLYWYLKEGEIPSVDRSILTDNLKAKRACFVTLEKRGIGLRGCMGMFAPVGSPLYKNVIDRTMVAATKDPRFKAVKPDELKDIKLEISVLTDPKPLKFRSSQELLSKLRPLRDGVIIKTKYGSSTYLPQVWEQLSDKREFLSRLCVKHGAPSNYWEANFRDIEVKTYQAIVFGEELYGRIVVGSKGAIVGRKGAFVIGAVKPLKEDFYFGGYKVNEGTELRPGVILTPDSGIIENQEE